MRSARATNFCSIESRAGESSPGQRRSHHAVITSAAPVHARKVRHDRDAAQDHSIRNVGECLHKKRARRSAFSSRCTRAEAWYMRGCRSGRRTQLGLRAGRTTPVQQFPARRITMRSALASESRRVHQATANHPTVQMRCCAARGMTPQSSANTMRPRRQLSATPRLGMSSS